MEASEPLDEIAFFGALQRGRVRTLLIGRRALIVLGAPVMTQDYDLWTTAEEAPRLNAIAGTFELHPNRSLDQARQLGRYVLEGGDRVDVLLAQAVNTVDGQTVRFEDLWARRREVWLDEEVRLQLPCLDDLIATKRFAARPKDREDLLFLEALREQELS